MMASESEEKNQPTEEKSHGLGPSQTVHFSFSLSGFIKEQFPHLHSPLSEGGFSPAAPQLNPPPVPLLVVVVFKGVGPNENADEVVEVDDVELGAPNRNSPEGGVGIERTFFEPVTEQEGDVPGLGASQSTHSSLADTGFIKPQAPHFHSSVFKVGGFNRTAPQSNPLELEFAGVAVVIVVKVLLEPKTGGGEGGFCIENDEAAAEGFSAPGFGALHTVHFSIADAGFIKSHTPHIQPPVFVGGFNPAALQLNPPEPELVEEGAPVLSVEVELAPKKDGVEGGLGMEKEDATSFAAPGLRAPQTVHFSITEAAFIKSQSPHFHPSP